MENLKLCESIAYLGKEFKVVDGSKYGPVWFIEVGNAKPACLLRFDISEVTADDYFVKWLMNDSPRRVYYKNKFAGKRRFISVFVSFEKTVNGKMIDGNTVEYGKHGKTVDGESVDYSPNEIMHMLHMFDIAHDESDDYDQADDLDGLRYLLHESFSEWYKKTTGDKEVEFIWDELE